MVGIYEGREGEESRPGELMKAVTYQGKQSVAIEMVKKPKIVDATDVIVKVTACSICSGSDSHLYSGEIPTLAKGSILGHEACGIIEAVGDEVRERSVGDRVVIAFDIACGRCSYCKRKEFSSCDGTNPEKITETLTGHRHAAVFGYSQLMGDVPGSQAEFVRVPFADVNCLKLPDEIPDEKGLYISDVLSTALHAVYLGEVGQGDTVAIWGLGPIGLYAARWAQIKGAGRVIGIDMIPERLELASKQLNIEVLDRKDLSSEQVVALLQGMIPGGADVVIEAVGFRFPTTKLHKIERALGMETDTPDILEECFTIVRKWGRVSIIGDYVGYANHFPIGHIMLKHLTVRSGQCPVQRYFDEVLENLKSGAIDPTLMISDRISLDQAPEYYSKLFNKESGCIKVLIKP